MKILKSRNSCIFKKKRLKGKKDELIHAQFNTCFKEFDALPRLILFKFILCEILFSHSNFIEIILGLVLNCSVCLTIKKMEQNQVQGNNLKKAGLLMNCKCELWNLNMKIIP